MRNLPFVILVIAISTTFTIFCQNSPSSSQQGDGIVPTGGTSILSATEVLTTTKLVADKIIRETDFDLKTKAWNFNTELNQLCFNTQNKGQSSIAYSQFLSPHKGELLLALSYTGAIEIFVNKQKVFEGKSQNSQLVEYGYRQYQFQEIIPINASLGANNIAIVARGWVTDAVVTMMPITEKNKYNRSVKFQSQVSTPNSSKWLLSGPYNSAVDTNKLLSFIGSKSQETMPSKEFKGWYLPASPVVKYFSPAPGASFKRDAYADWHYANGGTMMSVLYLGQQSKDEKYITFVEKYTDNILDNLDFFKWQYSQLHVLRGAAYKISRRTMLDDSGGPVLPFAQLRLQKGDKKHDVLLEEIIQYVSSGQERLADNTLCRPEPINNTIWADDLFMGIPFICRMGAITGETKYFDDAAHQILQFNKYLKNKETGLYFHGWYADKNEAAPIQWGRANGWVVWATSEALMLLPKTHEAYPQIQLIYTEHLEALCSYQAESGFWHQVLDHPDTYEETSCTAMFTLGLARGIRNGWINEKYMDNAIKGWKAISSSIKQDGTVMGICQGTGIGKTKDFYNDRKTYPHDPRGLGAVLTAGTEMNLLLSATNEF